MVFRRAAAVATAALFLTGCGGGDLGQRQAFTDFLQTGVLDKPGMHVAQPTVEERTSFGPYADQYAIITDFNKAMNESVSPKLAAAMNAGAITSLGDLVTHRGQLQAAKTTIDAMNGALQGDIARADAAHARLDQPADVKVVFDKTYDRLVTQPATAFKAIVPVIDQVLGKAIELGSYIEAHRGGMRVSGSTIETADPVVRSAINDRLRSLQASQQAIQSAQAKMQTVVYGRSSS